MSTVRVLRLGDAQAARAYAMVDVAMYDAVNGIAGRPVDREPALVAPVPGTVGDPQVAAATAAHDVLVGLYPARTSTYDAVLAATPQGRSPALAAAGKRWGEYVAERVLAARAHDGSQDNETLGAGSGAGVFPVVWSGMQFHALTPFAIDDPESYVSAGPPELTGEAYATAYNVVKSLGKAPAAGAATSTDDARLATFRYWALSGGTNQPPGAWLQVASSLSQARGLSLDETARLFALEAMALADTVAPTYETKARFRAWRPFTAIRQTQYDDNNPLTDADPQWTPRGGGGDGSSPEHWSGHSSFSAAGATVLAGAFCTDDISFTLDTDSTETSARTYGSFSEAASEAGLSRVYGGLHFPFSNEAGLDAGRAIGTEVLTTALQPRHAELVGGDCLP
jgi:hypothetical protein